MKPTGVIVAVLALLMPLVFAQTPKAPASGGPTAGKAAVPGKAPVAKEKEEEKIPPIEGITVPRANGMFLGVQVVNNNWVVKFFDAKKKIMKPDAVRASVRWAVKYQPADERTVLNPSGDGLSLTSPFVVRPPHPMKAYFTLFASVAPDATGEYIAVDYHD